MKKNPISVDKDTPAAQALSIMNDKKLRKYSTRKTKNKTIGIIHIHNILVLILVKCH